MTSIAAAVQQFIENNEYLAILANRIDTYPTDKCILCLEENITRYSNGCGCCETCAPYSELLAKNTDFKDKVDVAKETIESIVESKLKSSVIKLTPPNSGLTHSLLVPDTSIFDNTEKHLFFAASIAAFVHCRTAYFKMAGDKKFCVSKKLNDEVTAEFGHGDRADTVLRCFSTIITASYQVPVSNVITPDFMLLDKGVLAGFYFKSEGCDEISGMAVQVDTRYEPCGRILSLFSIEIIETGFQERYTTRDYHIGCPLYITSSDTKSMRAGRVIKVQHKTFTEDLVIRDEIYERAKQADDIKQAKKEKERKEQERREKKERQREEQRQLDYQRQEEEKALKAARATLVEAVAKVDADLEKIRKLRELNREVALKNQKIFERKEAERIAKEAERRHAEKLKQKELERQKFISKKL